MQSRYFPSVCAVVLSAAMLTTGSAAAASDCAGEAQSVCATSDSCIWVNGYTRKDGRAVSGHCKARPARKTVRRAVATEPSLSKLD